MQGYIKVHRKTMCSSIWQDSDLFRLWMYCLMKASHKEHSVIVEKQEVKLKIGEFVTGRFKLHQEFNNGISPRKQIKDTTLWSWLKKLEKIGNIDIKTFNKYSIISIVNWCEYQGTLTTEPQQTDNSLTAEPQQIDTYKNGNNEKNDNKKDISMQIENFRQRYSNNQLKAIDDYFEMLRHTRVSAKISGTVILGIYKDWDKHPPICVEHGVRTHTNNPAYHSRKESYTLGIIRNTKSDEITDNIHQEKPKVVVSDKAQLEHRFNQLDGILSVGLSYYQKIGKEEEYHAAVKEYDEIEQRLQQG